VAALYGIIENPEQKCSSCEYNWQQTSVGQCKKCEREKDHIDECHYGGDA
jgi:hypothetical protein